VRRNEHEWKGKISLVILIINLSGFGVKEFGFFENRYFIFGDRL
jgi:hypothetical protein